MSYFTSIGTEGALADVQRLRHIFRTQYHPFLDRLDSAVYPTKANRGGSARSRWNAGYMYSDKEKEQQSETQYVSHDIEQMLLSFRNRMVRSPILINVGRVPDDRKEGMQQGVVEDYCNGILERLNRQESNAVNAMSHTARMATFAGRYGKICQFVDVIEENGEWRFAWDFYHPRCVYHDFGSLPRRFVYEAYYSLPQVERKLEDAYGRERYRIAPAARAKGVKDLIRLTELWVEDRVDGKTLVSSQLFVEDEAASDPIDHPYTCRPFHVIADTGMGASFQAINELQEVRGDSTTPFQGLEDHARPFWASLIDNIAIHDDVRTLEIRALGLAVDPPVDIEEDDDADSSSVQDQPIGPGVKIIHKRSVRIKSLEFLSKQLDNFTTPRDLKEEKLRVFPSILYGATASANESNILYTSRIDEGENAIVGPALLVAIAYQQGFETILRVSREKDVRITMAVTRSRGRSQGQEHMVEFDARRDIPAAFGLKATVPPMLPRDSMKMLQVYQLAIQSGAYDEELAMRDLLRLQDPVSVMKRRLHDKVQNSEPAMQEAIIRTMFDEVEALSFEASREKDAARRMRLRRAAAYAMAAAEAQEARLRGRAPGFQQEPQPGVPAPAQQPPEERGYESPPLQRTMAGIGQPGGRPPLLEEGA